jgi:hypothetical protein
MMAPLPRTFPALFTYRGVTMGTHPEEQTHLPALLEEIKQQLSQIQFGSLEIQIHNGQVVQIERREKKRWDKGVNTR